MIAIADYDAGNIKSVEKALKYLGADPLVISDPDMLKTADKVIVPGVGAFADAMQRLKDRGMDAAIKDIAAKGTPLLGICLGLQIFFDKSEEALGISGLGLLPGSIVHFPKKYGYKIPHMGWNSIDVSPSSKLLNGVYAGSYVYFVHSYYLKADKKEDVSATTEYIVDVDAAVERDNIYATQFHPEKSGDIGLRILKNFIEL